MADGGHEPSMEDILSSIKRIIAEDSDAAMSGTRAKRSVAPARGERGSAERGASERQAPDRAVDEDDVLELTDPVAVEPPVQAQPAARRPVPPPLRHEEPSMPDAKTDPATVSPSTVEASRTSLAALSALVVKPVPAGSDTLEGLVRDMLRPMIAQWLDARLPEIVERQVAQEVRRISERG